MRETIMLKNIIFVGASTVLGTIAGFLTNPESRSKSTFLGAAIGLAAGTFVSALICKGLCQEDSIKYYGKSSGLYEGYEEAETI